MPEISSALADSIRGSPLYLYITINNIEGLKYSAIKFKNKLIKLLEHITHYYIYK